MKNKTAIIDKTVLIGSLFLLFNYVVYFIKILFWHEGALTYVISLFVIGFVILTLTLHKKGVLQKLFKKLYPIVKTLYAVALVFYMVTFLMLFFYTSLGTQNPPVDTIPKNSVVVTLGAKVRADSTPGTILRKRLNLSHSILTQREDLKCVVSGGKGVDEPISEAQSMKNYLTQNGISAERIIMEDNSYNTVENIKNTLSLLPENTHLTIVSNNFHILRVRYICFKLNVKNVTFFSVPDSNPATLYSTLVREYMSYLKLFILGV